MEAEWQSAQYLRKLLLLRPLRCLLQSIVFLLVKTETYFMKFRLMPVPFRVKERLSYLWGSKVTSLGLGVLRVLNTRYHLVSLDRTSLVPSGLFG